MKTKLIRLTCFLTALLALAPVARAQSTAFTYQGRLNDGAGPATGLYDLRFALYDLSSDGSQQGGFQTKPITDVTNGLFTVKLDFGNQFPGADRWLEIQVRTNGGSVFSVLAPRQLVTATPYAITAGNLTGTVAANQLTGTLPAASLAGTYGGAVNFSNAANAFTGNAGGLTNLNAANLVGTVPATLLSNAWRIDGNSGTSPTNGNFLGTTDDQPLELKVNGQRVVRWERNTNAPIWGFIVPNIVSGHESNTVANGVGGATIAGGGGLAWFGSTSPQTVSESFGTIGGGVGNVVLGAVSTIAGGERGFIGTNAFNAFLGGGAWNSIEARDATIGGGRYNFIWPYAHSTFLGGGDNNTIQTDASYATIVGGYQNTIQSNAVATTIGGGTGNTIQTHSSFATIGGGYQNTIWPNDSDSYGTIAGGGLNTIQTNAFEATIGGGYANTIGPNTERATIGGGYYNTIQTDADSATLSGGHQNTIQPNNLAATIGGGIANTIMTNAQRATIGGGHDNTIYPDAFFATIAGGYQNTIQPNAFFATIPGGYLNSAASYAFAAGRRAKANHPGSFVWGDSQDADFASTGANQFCIRANGGVQLSGDTKMSFGSTLGPKLNLYSTSFGLGIQSGVLYSRVGAGGGFAWYAGGFHNDATYNSGGGTTLMKLDGTGLTINNTFVSASDRNLKQDFSEVNSREVLEKVAQLPIQTWAYKSDPGTKHLGPMAQDFYAAFAVGPDDKHITTVDESGVALAAIQGLNQKVEAQQLQLEQKQTEIAELKARMEKLEQLMNHELNGSAR